MRIRVIALLGALAVVSHVSASAAAVDGDAADLLPVTFCGDPGHTVLSPGADFSFVIPIRNVGNTPTVAGWTAEYRLSPDPDVDASDLQVGGFGSGGPALEPKTEHVITDHAILPGDLAPGRYHLGVIVDNNDVVPERNEANNTRLYCGPLFVQ